MSFQLTITPSKRAAGRFIEAVRRALLKAYEDESAATGLSQSDIARTIGVDRSIIHRELRGHKDITMGRVAELAWAMGRKAEISLSAPPEAVRGSNINTYASPASNGSLGGPAVREMQN